jgi:hypothetical protein
VPSKAYKLLNKMRRSNKGWKTNDLLSLYEGFGFIIKHGASHEVVKHPDFPQFRETISRTSHELSPAYVRDAIANLEKLGLIKPESENEDE